MDNLRNVTSKLMDFTYRMQDGAELSGDEIAELVGLQIALDTYKELLGVEEMEIEEFFNYI